MTHTTTATAVRGGLLAAAALLLATAAPADATPQESARGDWLYVTVTTGDARSSDTRGTLLLCDPPQGHRHAAEACAQLATAAGDIHAFGSREGYCPMIYAPVTAHARGRWQGRPVEYRETFSNTCVMGARTGAVFALDG
ncbi:SSI family serine proteinase inhibitor [Streptomyces resistomycificus]|uniref:Serine protease n=1 Tax=Streptomyces resistomycificus TaxID=67356 RepID=A0A0L8KPQ5_9ACTN|nr:SSI family serine proteinase inhibitor [Streptomyces resistomycificus]KOG27902.1 serine protease [Streptomyces resistomycificus]KUO02297.1 serine protease [Streptomyces resistomycificus]